MNQLWYRIESVFPLSKTDWSSVVEVYRDFEMENTEQLGKGIVGYLKNTDSLPILEIQLKEKGALGLIVSEVKEEQWAESWKQFFKPKAIGKRFWIQPTWEQGFALEDKLCIEIDPGQAFGTGDHPTTCMCLVLLEKSVEPNFRVADIGCGSGILSIGACLLGASEVLAVDTDSNSVESARLNAVLNGVQYEVYQGKGFAPINKGKKFDLVVSNIISAAIIGLVPEVIGFLKPEGKWIISGIIKENWEEVKKVLNSFNFKVICVEQEGEWIAALLHR